MGLLESVFQLDAARAVEAMVEVHERGEAAVSAGDRAAPAQVTLARQRAREHFMPLRIDLRRAE